MKNTTNLLVLIVVAALTALLTVRLAPSAVSGEQAAGETAYQRVTTTKTIRCAYAVWPPMLMADPNTGKLTGIDYDVVEKIAKNLGFTVEWVAETGFSQFIDMLRTRKADMMCTTVAPIATRAPHIELTKPLHFSGFIAVVRADDKRFDGNLKAADNPAISVVVTDGTLLDSILDATLPQAKRYALQMDADVSQVMTAVMTGKADLAFLEPSTLILFNRANNNALRPVAGVPPVHTNAEAFAVLKGERDLRDLFDVALDELHQNGMVENIIMKYEPAPHAILRAAKPYQE